MRSEQVFEFYYNIFTLSRHCREYRYDVIAKNDLFHIFLKLYSSNNGQKLNHNLTSVISPYINDRDTKGLIGLYLQNTTKDIWIKDLIAMLQCIGVTVLNPRKRLLDDDSMLERLIDLKIDKLDNELNVLAHVINRERKLWDLRADFRRNPDIVLAAVKQNGIALRVADPLLQKDRDIVLAAVKRNGYALEFADGSLKEDRDIVLAAVKESGESLQFADLTLKKDREIVLAAVKQNGCSLRYADLQYTDAETLKKDREIVLAAVKQNGEALRYADQRWTKDREIVLLAVDSWARSLEFAHEDLRKDKKFVISALKINGSAFGFVKDLYNDKDVILTALNNWKDDKNVQDDFFDLADPKFRKDPEVMFLAVRMDAEWLSDADEELRKDPELAEIAVKSKPETIKYVHIDNPSFFALLKYATERDASIKYRLSKAFDQNDSDTENDSDIDL